MRTFTHCLVFLFAVLSGCFLPGCKSELSTPAAFPLVSDYSSKVLQDWNAKFLEIERDAEGYRPLPATRALAYLGLSAYEACITGMPDYKSIAVQYAGLQIPVTNSPENMHWPTVVNASYGYLMHRFFPAFDGQVTELEDLNNSVYQGQIDAISFSLSQQYGRDVAAAIWAWSKTDAIGHDAYLEPFKSHQYPPTNVEPGPKPLFPSWGLVRTFAITESDKVCAAPWPYGEDETYQMYAEGLEVYARTTNQSPEDLWMGGFWSDDFLHLTFSTGPRWISIANQIYENDAVNLAKAVYTNAKVGLVLNDAAVACWASKFHYQVKAPTEYIQHIMDPAWETALKNPLTGETEFAARYPSYPSEHAAMAGAAAEVLTSIFGLAFSFTDKSHVGATLFDGLPRTFSSFYEMAEENAGSRVPAGVNFRMDAEQGVSLGYRCGKRVNELTWQ